MLRFVGQLLSGAVTSLHEESVRRLATLANPYPDWRTELYFSDDREVSMPTQKSTITEFGLLLPNGQVLWNNYSNHSLNTPADRNMMVQILRKTAEECGFTESEFLSHYSWVSRRVQTEITDLGSFTLNDPVVIGVDEQTDLEDTQTYDDHTDSALSANTAAVHGDGGDLCPGSMGGVAPGSA